MPYHCVWISSRFEREFGYLDQPQQCIQACALITRHLFIVNSEKIKHGWFVHINWGQPGDIPRQGGTHRESSAVTGDAAGPSLHWSWRCSFMIWSLPWWNLLVLAPFLSPSRLWPHNPVFALQLTACPQLCYCKWWWRGTCYRLAPYSNLDWK